ncbi:hypothetical protein C1637_18550 [Chryseobacterium lactis]|uniref:Uncharacterized protein n=1 Tax=Chryseobacterium lactis TaxID=1241981 RepID=A0A3G6RJL1_CHRLC|nr:hypothetical protein [Chryseobacterium lactis]AZA84783.1 hypothetical protein EG342_24055 [Chryseobacterium lactis]AZB05172.1 hypothetical protein EG341_14935 [Chryseobacterium lactis]PNW12154.1 hypothetical protein C1637_18550 [Chryseobacterium lactis]
MANDKLQEIFNSRKSKEEKKTKESKKDVVKDLTPFEARYTAKKLDEWKKEYGNRDLIYLKVDDFLAVLRPPKADDLGDYLTAIGSNGMSKAVAMIVEQLWIEGDYQLIEDEDCFIAVFLQMNNILESKKADFFRA